MQTIFSKRKSVHSTIPVNINKNCILRSKPRTPGADSKKGDPELMKSHILSLRKPSFIQKSPILGDSYSPLSNKNNDVREFSLTLMERYFSQVENRSLDLFDESGGKPQQIKPPTLGPEVSGIAYHTPQKIEAKKLDFDSLISHNIQCESCQFFISENKALVEGMSLANRELRNKENLLGSVLQENSTLKSQLVDESQKRTNNMNFLFDRLEVASEAAQKLARHNEELVSMNSTLKMHVSQLEMEILNLLKKGQHPRHFIQIDGKVGDNETPTKNIEKLQEKMGLIRSHIEEMELKQSEIIESNPLPTFNKNRVADFSGMTELQGDGLQEYSEFTLRKHSSSDGNLEIENLRKKLKSYKKKNKRLKKEVEIAKDYNELENELSKANLIIRGLEEKIYKLLDAQFAQSTSTKPSTSKKTRGSPRLTKF